MLSSLLRPLSHLYGFFTDVRNYLYDAGIQKSLLPEQKTINIGNLTVGGTGKTPMVEYLLERFGTTRPAFTIATLSRGYGRRTRGFRIAGPADSAATIGDEPMQLYRKFGDHVWVIVGERRADALRLLHQQLPEANLVLLDDAFQHRAVRPHLNILLMDYNRPFYLDHPFPAGRLRERRHGANRADVVIVTKCPHNLSVAQQEQSKKSIHQYTQDKAIQVYFAGLAYAAPKPFNCDFTVPIPGKVVLISGIAQAKPLETYVSQAFQLKKHWQFGDHHAYTRADIDRILTGLPTDVALLTTEKDWVKLGALFSAEELDRLPLFYLPVKMQLLAGEEKFMKLLAGVSKPA